MVAVKSRIDDIEILRAFAVMLVIVEHMQINLFHWGTPALKLFFRHFSGWSGVDLFFVISGFVIARNLMPKLQAAASREAFFRVSLLFWIRRFWRLLPSAWTWLAVILACAAFFNSSGAFGPFINNLKTVVAAFLQVANFHGAMVYGREFAGPAFVYWSLSLEEQFYLVLPFLILVSGRRLPLVLGLIVIPQLFIQRDTPLLALVRTDALFLGVLLAIWSHSSSYQRLRPCFLGNPLLALCFALVLLGSLATLGSGAIYDFDHRYGPITCLAALLVWAASYDGNFFARGRWLKIPLLWVGTRSYALYLIHLPSYFLTREIWFRLAPEGTKFNTDYTWYFLGTALTLLIVLSELNYRFIETPCRRRGVEIARRLAARRPPATGEQPS